MKAIVITPTIGSPDLVQANLSVRNQTIPTTHLIVVDGLQYAEKVDKLNIEFDNKNTFKCQLPFNTGANGWYGQRIMSAFSYLTDFDYILFLDQDCWFDENHVESLVDVMEKTYFDWAYSLRKIYDKEGNFLCQDNCESLGRWPIWNGDSYLIDNNCYIFSNHFLKENGHFHLFGWGADRRFYEIIKQVHGDSNYACSGLYTANYRLGGGTTSPLAEFFFEGNMKTAEQYRGDYPWAKT